MAKVYNVVRLHAVFIIAVQFPLFGSLGLQGVTATIWMNWTLPVFLTEVIFIGFSERL